MKITREFTINGTTNNTEYELTGIELERAYNEYTHTKDTDALIEKLDDCDYEDIDGIPEEIISDMVQQVRDKMSVLMDDAILDVIRKNDTRLAPYKEKMKVFEFEMTRITRHSIRIAAKNEDDANTFMENKFGYDEYEFDKELEEEDSEYDYGYAEEVGGDPEYADYNAEEE